MNRRWCSFCETETEHDGEICLDCNHNLHDELLHDDYLPDDDSEEEDDT